ncbi:MAG: hypothetical protein GY703_21865 [Gammaproteobacteria bacterium]|nr:hypothetical protein [Gammaproteobacteria bacterium]
MDRKTLKQARDGLMLLFPDEALIMPEHEKNLVGSRSTYMGFIPGFVDGASMPPVTLFVAITDRTFSGFP